MNVEDILKYYVNCYNIDEIKMYNQLVKASWIYTVIAEKKTDIHICQTDDSSCKYQNLNLASCI